MSRRTLSPAIALAVIVSLVPLVNLQGQSVAPGTRLRWKEGPASVRGTATDSASVLVNFHPTPQPIPWDNPTLEYQVRKSSRGQAAGVGLGFGLVAGLLIGAASGDDRCGTGQWCIMTFSAGEKAAMGAMVLAPLGALIGAAASPGDRWAPVGSAREAARVSFHLDHRMLGLRATF